MPRLTMRVAEETLRKEVHKLDKRVQLLAVNQTKKKDAYRVTLLKDARTGSADIKKDLIREYLSGEAKGNEFDVVFFIGLEDNILPDYRNHEDEDKLAEERRIFYVGLTRARKAAYLTSATNRPPRSENSIPSRFIGHIPDEYFSKIAF